MSSLNLSGLKLNKTAALSIEEFQSLQDTKSVDEQNQAPIQEEPKQEQPEKPKTTSSFTLSLSSLIGGDNSSSEAPSIGVDTNPVITEETPELIEIDKTDSSVSQLNIPTPQIVGVSIIQEVTLQEQTTTSSSDIVSKDSEELMDISMPSKDEAKVEEPVIEEKKEFFKNFNVIDVFAEEKKSIIKATKKLEDKKDAKLLVQEKLQENITIVSETKTSSQNKSADGGTEILQIEETEKTIAELTECNSMPKEITKLEESTIIDVTAQVVVEQSETLKTPKVKNNDQIKKDLSTERKPGGISFFKKKSVMFSILGLFVISGVIYGITGINDGKTNIQEIKKTTSGIKQNNSYQEGFDFTIIKNKKKNIKKSKIILPQNQDEIGNSIPTSLSGEPMNSDSGTILGITPTENADSINKQNGLDTINPLESSGNVTDSNTVNGLNSNQEIPLPIEIR